MNQSPLHAALRFGATLALLLCSLPALHAKPDLTTSEILAESKTVIEGGVARFRLKLRNTGDEPADPTHLRIQWPTMGHLIEVTGVNDAQQDPDARVTTASIALPAGVEREVGLDVLAPREAGGAALSLTVQAIHYHTMAETWIHQTVNVDTRRRTDGLLVGGLRIAPAGIVTFIWLVVTVLAVLTVRLATSRGSSSPIGPVAGVIGIMIAIGFWLVFAGMAWHDWRVLKDWRESTATIVGRRVVTQSVDTTLRRDNATQTRQQDVSKPEFALRYTVDGRTMLSTGYDTGSSLRRGGGKAQLEKEFREWTVGAQVPCWYDPHNPADVVVKRGFGGAYVFAVLPLFPFWLGWTFLRRSFSKAGD